MGSHPDVNTISCMISRWEFVEASVHSCQHENYRCRQYSFIQPPSVSRHSFTVTWGAGVYPIGQKDRQTGQQSWDTLESPVIHVFSLHQTKSNCQVHISSWWRPHVTLAELPVNWSIWRPNELWMVSTFRSTLWSCVVTPCSLFQDMKTKWSLEQCLHSPILWKVPVSLCRRLETSATLFSWCSLFFRWRGVSVHHPSRDDAGRCGCGRSPRWSSISGQFLMCVWVMSEIVQEKLRITTTKRISDQERNSRLADSYVSSILFQAVHGKQCRHPFTNTLLPIITDPLVDMQLGTGDTNTTSLTTGWCFIVVFSSCVHVSQVLWKWLLLMTTRTSCCHRDTHYHASLWLKETGQWCPSVDRGWRSLLCLTGRYEYLSIGTHFHHFHVCVCVCQGVKRFDARQLVLDALVEKKLFRGKKIHSMTLPVCR